MFDAWEEELALLFEARPAIEEFWHYWREREEAIEGLVTPDQAAFVDAAFDRLMALAEAHGYCRLPAAATQRAARPAADVTMPAYDAPPGERDVDA
ncbi:hypothetical protein [Luteimonas sp. FCS-9]|uniref:hypothetical protein n=1 Tax=Luteimonas sp. FCS-9 TaxID=1547516 RepID=UPI00063EAAE6|nr:hypothetical protein [Luteimonas sp. FCS-9]KLI98391.1 hypothetical protein WQ56_15180 [Luteimonas sp. FCS-9]